MEDVFQSQIQESCRRLALPNGLKELMHDISREVLRSQPPDILKFITEYLSALLVTRENMYIASKVCGADYDCKCRPELEDELRYIGLDDQNASDAAEVIEKFLGIGEGIIKVGNRVVNLAENVGGLYPAVEYQAEMMIMVNEGNIILQLVKKTSIDESHLPAVLSAVRQAFLRHQTNHTKFYESSSDSDEDDVARAARHTLKLYRKTNPTFETYNCMATRIQASYRAYKIRRESGDKRSTKSDHLSKFESLRSINEATGIDHLVTPIKTENEKTKVTFGALDHVKESIASDQTGTGDDEDVFIAGPSKAGSGITTRLSSTSLAGSYLSLPQYKPYSAHDLEDFVSHEKTPVKERSHYNFAIENSPVEEIFNTDMAKENEQKDKKNIFYESHDEDSVEEILQSYEEVEENILECIEKDIVGVDIVKLAEGMVDETTRGKDLNVKFNAENISNESFTKQNISDENTEERYTLDENFDNVSAENDDTVPENIVEGDIVDDLPNLSLVEDIPEEIDLDVDIMDEDEETYGNFADVLINASYKPH